MLVKSTLHWYQPIDDRSPTGKVGLETLISNKGEILFAVSRSTKVSPPSCFASEHERLNEQRHHLLRLMELTIQDVLSWQEHYKDEGRAFCIDGKWSTATELEYEVKIALDLPRTLEEANENFRNWPR